MTKFSAPSNLEDEIRDFFYQRERMNSLWIAALLRGLGSALGK
jgi:hypothetical protein